MRLFRLTREIFLFHVPERELTSTEPGSETGDML